MLNLGEAKNIESVFLMRMARDESYGLAPETFYDDIYYRQASKMRIPYEDDLQEKQIQYTGVRLADWAMHGRLALGRVQVRDLDYGSTTTLCTLTDKAWTPALKEYLELIRVEDQLSWLFPPGFEYDGVHAWLVPAKEPALLFRPTISDPNKIEKCSNYIASVDWVESYVGAIKDGSVVVKDVRHPFF